MSGTRTQAQAQVEAEEDITAVQLETGRKVARRPSAFAPRWPNTSRMPSWSRNLRDRR